MMVSFWLYMAFAFFVTFENWLLFNTVCCVNWHLMTYGTLAVSVLTYLNYNGNKNSYGSIALCDNSQNTFPKLLWVLISPIPFQIELCVFIIQVNLFNPSSHPGTLLLYLTFSTTRLVHRPCWSSWIYSHFLEGTVWHIHECELQHRIISLQVVPQLWR